MMDEVNLARETNGTALDGESNTMAVRPGPAHEAALRRHTGIPSLAVSPKNGRLWATFYGGVTPGEDSNSYVGLLTSADGGKSWKAVCVAEPEAGRRIFDPGLWVAPDGKLRWTLTSRACQPNPADNFRPYGGDHGDARTDRLLMAELDAESEPEDMPAFRQIADGVMMCKPIALRDGTWLFPVAHWREEPSACFHASTDGGRTFSLRGGVSHFPRENREFDEHTVVELKSGDLLTFIRAQKDPTCLESVSHDGGRTWAVGRKARFEHTNSRHFLMRLKSGNLLLVKNGPIDRNVGRKEMTAFLSTDDGATWTGGLMLDPRENVSYPDGDQAADGTIYIAYDHDRLGGQEILFAAFAEDEVLAGEVSRATSVLRGVVTRASPLDIDCGRQLFVDDVLIGSTDGVARHWNRPVKAENPVVWPGDGAGRGVKDDGKDANLTCATDGGLWWDPTRGKYRLWYQADWLGNICYAESADGLTWTYPDLGVVKGTNRVFEREDLDSWNVSPDYFSDAPYANWKLFISSPGGCTKDAAWASADGLAFDRIGTLGHSGDRTTVYGDPFRGTWVFSLRDFGDKGRCRAFYESRELKPRLWRFRDLEKAVTNAADYAGLPEPEPWLVATNRPNWQLYSFTAVPYESLMFGVMEILYNTPNDNKDSERAGLPKQTALHFCFSRDGKTYVPRDEADIAPSGWGSGKWDTGYLSVVGGICTVDDDRLTFHYSGLRGDRTRLAGNGNWWRNGMYSNGAIGIATLRRDGFAGMVADGRGMLTTKTLAFSGAHLFVNAECRFGSVRAEILDADGKPVPGFTADDCAPLAQTDATKAELVFKGGDLSRFGDGGVRIRFLLHCATLYAFWLSPSTQGESRGYVAAGGPAYPGLRDTGNGTT
ncbi:MAG: sialidase family protein [Kiritimatiellia bacterium]|jgi:hypothetical protein